MKETRENILKFYPAVTGSGFSMEGYYIWCGSVVKEGDTYYLFAARWRKESKFPEGYLSESEIVMATTDDLRKPFVFQKVVIGKRDGGYWDSMMAHNPFLFKTEQGYYLFYIGSPDGGIETRAIGYAFSEKLTGEWKRSDQAIALPANANNPCVVEAENGDVLLFFRDGALKVSVARAARCEEPFEVLQYDLFPSGCVEDMFVYRTKDGYEMIAEDAVGKHTGLRKSGVRFTSPDGIHWDEKTAEAAYDFTVQYDDGTVLELQRRERPILLWDQGRTYLFTAAKINGETMLTGGDTWNLVQEVKSE